MNIVPMKSSEMHQYVRVFMDAFTSEPWNEPWDQKSTHERLSRFMDTSSSFGLALEEEGEVIAFVLGQYEPYHDGMRFCIQEFCCARRRGGYGTTLLSALEQRLKQEGIVRICLMTVHGDATQGYYGRRGYLDDPDNIWMYKTDL